MFAVFLETDFNRRCFFFAANCDCTRLDSTWYLSENTDKTNKEEEEECEILKKLSGDSNASLYYCTCLLSRPQPNPTKISHEKFVLGVFFEFLYSRQDDDDGFNQKNNNKLCSHSEVNSVY